MSTHRVVRAAASDGSWPKAPKWCECFSTTVCPHAYCPNCGERTDGTNHLTGTPAGTRCGQPARYLMLQVAHKCGHTTDDWLLKTPHAPNQMRRMLERLPCKACTPAVLARLKAKR